MKKIFQKYKYNKKFMYGIFFTMNIIILGLFFTLNKMSDNMITHNKHLTYSVTNTKYLVVQSHLWLEEYLSGDKEEYPKIFLFLTNIKKELDILNQGGVIRGISYDATNNLPEITNYLKQIKKELIIYEELLKKRIETSLVEDKEFDSQFSKLLVTINQLDIFVEKKFIQIYNNFINIKYFFLILIVVLFFISFIIIDRFNKRLERNIKVINHQAKRLEELNATLKTKVKKAISKSKEDEKTIFNQEKIIRMNELLRNIAHHWRQPLSVISGIVSSLKLTSQLNILKKEDLEKDLEKALEQTENLSSVINYFNETIKDEDKKSKITIGEFIKSFSFLIDKAIQNKEIKIVKEIDDIDDIIYINTQRFVNVLLSLITNSIDALSKKEIKNKFIKIKAHKVENFLYISVEDNAGGIENSIIDNIFEPYFTTEHQDEGKGLSLYIAYETIKKDFSGSLNVQNKNKGASFDIKIKA